MKPPKAQGTQEKGADLPAPAVSAAQKKKADLIQSAKQADALVKGFTDKAALFLKDDVTQEDIRIDESGYHQKHKNLVRLVRRQSMVMLILVVVIIAALPFIQPIYNYYVKWPGAEKRVEPLVSLTEPNLTDQAILSWVATAITEIMTFGFGDIDQRVIAQSQRFTPEGWESFIGVLREHNTRTAFKMQQLVLTTVPSDSPVIVAKGLDEDMDYTWVVEMPIVMTYSTNNNVTSGRRSIVRLTIARMPSLQNKAGIGIKMWKMM